MSGPVSLAERTSWQSRLPALGLLESGRGFLLHTLYHDKGALVGLIFVVLNLVLVAVPQVLAPYAPMEATGSILNPPSSEHLFGTDSNGMDVFSRALWAPRVDLLIALSAVSQAFVLGIVSGVWVGYYDGRSGILGWTAEAVMRILDIFQAFPIFVLALALMAVTGRSIGNVVFVLVVLQGPIFLRLTRSAALEVRSRPFVEAARCSGNANLRLVMRHILPNSLSPALINASVLTGSAILITSGLSFVGAGVPAPTPEWGYMIATGASSLVIGAWWPAAFPGIMLGLTVLAFALLGDGLRKYLDPLTRVKR